MGPEGSRRPNAAPRNANLIRHIWWNKAAKQADVYAAGVPQGELPGMVMLNSAGHSAFDSFSRFGYIRQIFVAAICYEQIILYTNTAKIHHTA